MDVSEILQDLTKNLIEVMYPDAEPAMVTKVYLVAEIVRARDGKAGIVKASTDSAPWELLGLHQAAGMVLSDEVKDLLDSEEE